MAHVYWPADRWSPNVGDKPVCRFCGLPSEDPAHDIFRCFADEACYHGDGPCRCEVAAGADTVRPADHIALFDGPTP
jgi:hypothetical protein